MQLPLQTLRDTLHNSFKRPGQSLAIRKHISSFFMTDLLSTPRGRAFLFTQAANAEGSDEGAIFDRLLTVVDDEQLQKAVATHQADEQRHAEMFTACAKRQGVTIAPIPEQLALLPLIASEVGGFDAPLATPLDIVKTYLVLQVIEERATEQFNQIVQVLDKVDPASAVIVREIIKDEERHLKYCAAIIKRYAVDDVERQALLKTYREAEARAFAKQQVAVSDYLLANDLLPANKRWLWRAVFGATRPLTSRQLPYTAAHGVA